MNITHVHLDKGRTEAGASLAQPLETAGTPSQISQHNLFQGFAMFTLSYGFCISKYGHQPPSLHRIKPYTSRFE